MDWTKQQYNKQYENWVPWLEDQYLRLWGKDNKASYATKGACFLWVIVSSCTSSDDELCNTYVISELVFYYTPFTNTLHQTNSPRPRLPAYRK